MSVSFLQVHIVMCLYCHGPRLIWFLQIGLLCMQDPLLIHAIQYGSWFIRELLDMLNLLENILEKKKIVSIPVGEWPNFRSFTKEIVNTSNSDLVQPNSVFFFSWEISTIWLYRLYPHCSWVMFGASRCVCAWGRGSKFSSMHLTLIL